MFRLPYKARVSPLRRRVESDDGTWQRRGFNSRSEFIRYTLRDAIEFPTFDRDELVALLEAEEDMGKGRTMNAEEARQQFLDETVDAPDIGMVRGALRAKGKETIDKETIRNALIIAEADTGLVSFNPDDNTFSVHQKPEEIMKEMDRGGGNGDDDGEGDDES